MKLENRTLKGSKVRAKGFTPGIMYGKGIDPIQVQVKTNDFQKNLKEFGTTKTFQVTLDGKKHIVYVKETQSFSENHNIKTHFDLIKVAADDTMTSKINVVFVNHTEVEKRGLIVQTVMSSVEVEYQVGSGISHLDLDVSGLEENDTLLVSDITAPEGITIVDDMDAVVVSIATPKEEVEETDEDEVTEVESIKQSNE